MTSSSQPLSPLDASAVSDCVRRNLGSDYFADRVFNAACDLYPRLNCNGDQVLAAVRQAYLSQFSYVSRSARAQADGFVG